MTGLDPRVRGLLFGLLGYASLLGITQFLLPGTGEGGTPTAILFRGLVLGLLSSLIAMGVVLIYRNIRIINFAQASLGAIGGVFTYNFTVLADWPFLLSALAGLLVATAVGVAVEIVFIRRFFNAPRLVLTVITIALVGFLDGAAGYVSQLPVFGDVRERTTIEQAGAAPIEMPFSNFVFFVGDFPTEFKFGHVLAIVACLLAMLGVAVFLRFSKSGTAIRAISENAERAPMLGINVGNMSMIVWAIAGFLSGLGIILNGAVIGTITRGSPPPEILLVSFAAAVIAKMRSLPVAIFSAIGLTILREATRFSFQDDLPLLDLGLFLIIVASLLFFRPERTRSEDTEAASWKAVEEYRAMPKELLQVSGVRFWRLILIALGVLAVLLFPWLADTRQTNLGGYTILVAMVILSLVVLTGWAGQVSIGQFALVGVAAIVGGAITSRMNISFWLALLIVPVFTAGFSMLMGLPALRIRGLYLGIVTFAFAVATRSVLFNEKYFGWLLPDRVDRPTLLLFDFEEERSMYYLLVIFFIMTVLAVSILRRSRPGRVLIALRENENNLQSFGVNIVKTRLIGFATSGFIAGLAGFLLAHHQRAVTGGSFEAELSLNLFLYGVIGGIGSISGALLGVGYFALNQALNTQAPWNFLVGPVFILTILYVAPGGLASIFFGLRDGILRIVAQRRQMLVPSLFADMDPEAMRRKLIPLAEPISNTGLLALPYSRRYRAKSELYGGPGWLSSLKRTGPSKISDEAAALGAASRSAEEDETPPSITPAEGAPA